MESIMDFLKLVKALFDLLEAVPFFGPALVIGTSIEMVVCAIKSK